MTVPDQPSKKHRKHSKVPNTSGIPFLPLDSAIYPAHKEGFESGNFGMNNTNDLIEGRFGVYSSINTKKSVGPVKTMFNRISLVRSGTANCMVDLETFKPVRNSILFGFPGQILSFEDPSDDFFAYYAMFSDEFMADEVLLKRPGYKFPFLAYDNVHHFLLSEEEGKEIEALFLKINEEVKSRNAHFIQVIGQHVYLIMIIADRCYHRTQADRMGTQEKTLFSKFIKSVSENFMSVQKVSEYADMLQVSPDHLNRIIKAHSDKTAHEYIDKMILLEAKACLMYTSTPITEIAYNLGFSDPSNFSKFFKKGVGITPLQYRNTSD